MPPSGTAVVEAFYDAAFADDLAGMLAVCAPDADWVYPTIDRVGWSRAWKGHDQIARWGELHDAEDEILDFRPETFVADGDRVVVLGFGRFKALATGSEWETRFVHAVVVRAGKIQRFEAYFDTAACAAAHGLGA